MDSRYTIMPARPHDVRALAAIELAAAGMFEGHALEAVLRDCTQVEEFEHAQAGGRLWIAATDDVPVGFALVELLPSGLPHLDEIDVDPRHGRRGIGTALVGAVCQWAVDRRHRELTLTTFRDVPWNMPFYQRLGFEVLPEGQWSEELAQVVREEAARGLDPACRVVMRCGFILV